jgi:uncharacterized peroxidase-related enzyme
LNSAGFDSDVPAGAAVGPQSIASPSPEGDPEGDDTVPKTTKPRAKNTAIKKTVIKKTVAERQHDAAKRARPGKPRHDDDVMALKLRPAKLSPAMAAFFKLCDEKLGFVPNVMKAFSFDMAKLEAFVAYRNDLMQGGSGLSTLEREMIATAVSAQNRCFYCLTVHGASVRQLSGDPVLGELMAMNYRAARLSKRQRAMLDFAIKLTVEPWASEESDRARLRAAGFSDRDIWDIAAVASFYNMTNRLASATDMRPNSSYHAMARSPK